MKSWYKFYSVLHFIVTCTSLAQDKCMVNGYVIDSVTLKPIENVNILVSNTSFATTTDSLGFFKFSLPTGNKYSIAFSHLAYKNEIRVLSIEKQSKVELRIKLLVEPIEYKEINVEGKIPFEEKRVFQKLDGIEFSKLGEKNIEKAMIYFFPDIVYPLRERITKGADYDFTLYVNGEWKDSIYLDEIDPMKIKTVQIWKVVGAIRMDMSPVNMPNRIGNYTISIITK